MTSERAKKIQVMRHLAILAGIEIMRIYEQETFEVFTKADQSPVTLADQVADRLIYDGLMAVFPDACVVTEEQVDSHHQPIGDFFIVDPLDGTKEFVQRRGEFTVNIAWIEQNIPSLGVVYAPAHRRLFYTDGAGASVAESGECHPTTPREARLLSVAQPETSGLTVVASQSHRNLATDDYIKRYTVANTRSAGSSLKFCLLAAGEAHLYPRFGRTMEWDTAAGQAVLTGAGGQVVRADNLAPLTYGKPGFENPNFIATVPGIDILSA